MARGEQIKKYKEIIEQENEVSLREKEHIKELQNKVSEGMAIDQMAETNGFKLLLEHMKETDEKYRSEWESAEPEKAQLMMLTAKAHKEILGWIRAKVNTGKMAQEAIAQYNKKSN